MIPVSNPQASYQAHQAEIDDALRRVLDSGWYVGGEEVAAFEAEFATYLGVKHCIAVGSGTAALHLALAYVTEHADAYYPADVIVPSLTAVGSVAPLTLLECVRPVYAEVDPRTLLLDPVRLEALVTPQTRALLPVHLYGHPANMGAVCAVARKHGIPVIEDGCQAHGARWHHKKVGTWGLAGCFSFYPTKNLGALGDAGAIVTDDDWMAQELRAQRQYGWQSDDRTTAVGGFGQSRMDPVQAAVLRVKLHYLDAENTRRQDIAVRYHQAFSRLSHLVYPLPFDLQSVYHQFVLVVRTPALRSTLRAFLAQRDILTAVHYAKAVHQQVGYGAASLPVTEALVERVVSLPMYPQLSDAEVEAVIQAVEDWACTL